MTPSDPSDSNEEQQKKLEEEIHSAIPADAAERLQRFLSHSLSWSGRQLEKLSDSPFVDRTGFARSVKEAGDRLKKAAEDAPRVLETTLADLHEAFDGAFQSTVESYRLADSSVRRSVMENVPAVSIMGNSFRAPDHEVQTSFRKDGKDISVPELIQDFRKSGRRRLVVFLPGLFSDESLWANSGTPFSYVETVESLDGYSAFVRFPPLQSIPETGARLKELLHELKSGHPDYIDIVAYSEGGLILRSALYQDRPTEGSDSKVASNSNQSSGSNESALAGWIRHVLMISSPDGGSFLEKMGFWIGLGLAGLSQLANQLLNYPELERSPAIEDLSLGRIRPEDQGQTVLERIYFGELDAVPATQIYSLVTKNNNVWESWLGDGVVEEVSLARLSADVYARKENPANRVHCILGRNHFQILNDPAITRILRSVLDESFSDRKTG
ncbi:MAG: hypothetical protein CMN76_15845 [Spirochaetaceae bacterium]|nr:hypothetical protein [Spirochaetaceae bacterium]|tara:strand:- start:19986 stop:21311 length:1326 start_codon:yes stop_codon:yes gene_type:complete